MVKGIEHVGVFSRDTGALRDWYAKMFGFRTVYDNGKGTYFLMATDGSMIELVKAEEYTGIPAEKASGIRHLALTADDFEGMVEKLLEEKVEVIHAASVSSSGVKTFFFRDPDGNVLHLISRPEPLG